MFLYNLRQARISQTLRSALILLPPRRCYSALAAFKPSPSRGLDSHEHQSAAGPSHASTETEQTDHPIEYSDNTIEDRNKSSETSESNTSKKTRRSKSSLTTPTSRKPLQPSRVETYLSSLQAAGLQPSLADLERCRPAKHAHPNSPQYTVDYNTLLDTLNRSFSKEQLRKFLEQWDPNCVWCRSHRKKIQYAEAIVERMWTWPSLKDIERAKRDRTEVSVKSIPVSASQLFLILGRDGADLLQMSMEYNVHISLVAHPLALRVEGLRGSLKQLNEHITSLKKDILEETLELPAMTPIRSDMVQRISRLAGAYLENIGSRGKVRICARSQRNLEIAKRLAIRVGHELDMGSHPPIVSYLPSEMSNSSVPAVMFPRTYSVYPFLSPRSLPWTINIAGAFRVRRVGEWLGHPTSEDIRATGGLAGGNGHMLTAAQWVLLHVYCHGATLNSHRDPIDLKNILFGAFDNLQEADQAFRSVKASTGHLLMTTTAANRRATLVPPLKGQHSFTKILKWMASNDVKASFVPSLPAPLIDSSPTHERFLHRLTYHAIHKSAPNDGFHEDSRKNPNTAPALTTKVFHLEIMLSQPRLARSGSAEDGGSSDSTQSVKENEDVPFPDATFTPHCWMGVETTVDLLIPDRPMDIRFSALNSSVLQTGKEPSELRTYVAGLGAFLNDDATQPDPPLMFHHGDDTFILHTSASVRQSTEHIDIPGSSTHDEQDNMSSFIKVITESILDLESDQKSTHCEIFCDNHASEGSWKRFLSECDKLTTFTTYIRPSIGNLDGKGNDEVL
ncbi:hypothetical protein AcV5_004709 [Taiwanofungus camphoratus]|nr:hypothetical protein AcW2_000689 [Antrodia cinnamomea]KAI0936618.1 hypothetical protein AcV5_004709 [Antrodia cinnamomea]